MEAAAAAANVNGAQPAPQPPPAHRMPPRPPQPRRQRNSSEPPNNREQQGQAARTPRPRRPRAAAAAAAAAAASSDNISVPPQHHRQATPEILMDASRRLMGQTLGRGGGVTGVRQRLERLDLGVTPPRGGRGRGRIAARGAAGRSGARVRDGRMEDVEIRDEQGEGDGLVAGDRDRHGGGGLPPLPPLRGTPGRRRVTNRGGTHITRGAPRGRGFLRMEMPSDGSSDGSGRGRGLGMGRGMGRLRIGGRHGGARIRPPDAPAREPNRLPRLEMPQLAVPARGISPMRAFNRLPSSPPATRGNQDNDNQDEENNNNNNEVEPQNDADNMNQPLQPAPAGFNLADLPSSAFRTPDQGPLWGPGTPPTPPPFRRARRRRAADDSTLGRGRRSSGARSNSEPRNPARVDPEVKNFLDGLGEGELDDEWKKTYRCPISHCFPACPVVTKHGNTYDRDAILEALRREPRSPLTREPLNRQHLYPNRVAAAAIEAYGRQLMRQREEEQGRERGQPADLGPREMIEDGVQAGREGEGDGEVDGGAGIGVGVGGDDRMEMEVQAGPNMVDDSTQTFPSDILELVRTNEQLREFLKKFHRDRAARREVARRAAAAPQHIKQLITKLKKVPGGERMMQFLDGEEERLSRPRRGDMERVLDQIGAIVEAAGHPVDGANGGAAQADAAAAAPNQQPH
ncbi:unnamed protein product [Vitrella brassicaformis CCMP3155]|uniref:U-box domain-containing protein n=2 Tax=Vitrella brassicaformis TaxID=1169539 RepID=A0A0G4FTR5_VITBC|nr:unnamed protein product [Vitrella brassicaformis CCMP3155]|eukprot:CEM18284.1 unnamed protein product [Vitrella brassicaformis CCMP3155]